MFHINSIRTKLILILVLSVIVVSISLGTITTYMAYTVANLTMEEEAEMVAQAYADGLQRLIEQYYTTASMIGRMGVPQSLTVNQIMQGNAKPQWDAFVENMKKQYGYLDVVMANLNGDNTVGVNTSDRDYFQSAVNGQPMMTAPTLRKSDESTVVFVAAPLQRTGVIDGTIAIVIDYKQLSEDIANIKVGEQGYSFIIDSAGGFIAHPNTELVSGFVNMNDYMAENSEFFKATENRPVGEVYMTEKFSDGGKNVRLYFLPIDTDNGWTLVVKVFEEDFMSNFTLTSLVSVGAAVVFIILGIVAALIFANGMTKPISEIEARMKGLAQGDIYTPMPMVNSRDEIGSLAGSMRMVGNNISKIVADINDKMGAFAQGDFSAEVEEEYLGDFGEIKDSMMRITDALNETLGKISESANQVGMGAAQVANGSQTMAQGTTEQASAIEELSASINDVSQKVKANAQSVSQATDYIGDASAGLVVSNQHMEDMLKAMAQINSSSAQISKIIKVIDDIAFQTNILALNAAVESARAGSAGKGFSVVAEEVRNLAAKSADAARQSAELIEVSAEHVRRGMGIADDTSKALKNVEEKTVRVKDAIMGIEAASSEQAQAIEQITRGVEQISSVVQANSAIAQESAATSEELSGEASSLQEAIGHFVLRGDSRKALPANEYDDEYTPALPQGASREYIGKY